MLSSNFYFEDQYQKQHFYIQHVLKHYSFEGVEDDENQLLALGALLTDLKFTLIDVIRYSEAMNRVDQFQKMTRGGTPNADTKKLLAEMIESKLESAKFEKKIS